MAASLLRAGLAVERQMPVVIEFEGMVLGEGFRADLVVEGQLLIEVKSVDCLAPVHAKQLLTYLRLSRRPLGLLMNFGGATFREGVRRPPTIISPDCSDGTVTRPKAAIRFAQRHEGAKGPRGRRH